MGKIITFYSYKGGVGRTMCLANVALLLAKWNHSVLVVDWDLEAPGLENFYAQLIPNATVGERMGVIDMLEEITHQPVPSPTIPFIKNWQNYVDDIPLGKDDGTLHLMTSGKRNKDYYTRVRQFDVKDFYAQKGGGIAIEGLRNFWRERYDFILIDSRTGITDIGGICTIQFPDILVLLFTATEQGFRGIGEVAEKVISAQKGMPLERLNLLLFPLLTRIDGSEKQLTKDWINNFIEGSHRLPISLNKIYSTWLPADVDRAAFVKQTLIPYVAYYSFGEGLPVLERDYSSDIQGMGYAYESITAVLATHLNIPGLLIQDRQKLLKISNKLLTRKEQTELEEVIKKEISLLPLRESLFANIKKFASGTENEHGYPQQLRNTLFKAVREALPSPSFSLSEVIQQTKGKGKQPELKWEEENPLDPLSDHVAVCILSQITYMDRDILISLKEEISVAVLEQVKVLIGKISDYSIRDGTSSHKQVENENLEKGLQLIVFELSRSIVDKVHFLISDSELQKLDRRLWQQSSEKPLALENKDPKVHKSYKFHLAWMFAALILSVSGLLWLLSNRHSASKDIDQPLIDSLQSQIIAGQYKDSANSFSNNKDTQTANQYYTKAVNQALVYKDTMLAIQILKDHAQNLSDSNLSPFDISLNQLLIAKTNQILFKIDIFYVDEDFEDIHTTAKFQTEYSEKIADLLVQQLSRESNFIIRKRMLRSKILPGNSFLTSQNEIRFNGRLEEMAAQRILALTASAFKSRRIELVLREIKSRNVSNYISIILKNQK
jgi:cellulose biosynthesis protein BcsQ